MTLTRRTPLRRTRATPRREVPEWKKLPERTGLGKVSTEPDRDPAFLAFVREHRCRACPRFRDIHAHHFGKARKGQKCSDYEATPLCPKHHREWHDRGTIGEHPRTYWLDDFRAAALVMRANFERSRVG